MTELMVPPSVLYAKPAARSRDGLAATQSRDAAAAGARTMAQGGHAVDAAVAVSLALGAVEPWMSGLGGGGFATLWDAKKREVRCLDYGMIAPAAIDPADYPLTGKPTEEGFFGWPGVLEDRNILGPHSIAVPGLVAGLSLAHRTYGRLPWGDLVQPAIALAERGLSLDWYGAMSLLVEAKGLDRFEAARDVYLPGGRVPQPFEEGVPAFLKLGRLIDTLKRLAAPDGPEQFYRGDIAADLIRDLQAAGSKISLADLERYQVRFIEPVEIAYRDAKVYAPSGLTAGPTLKRVLTEWLERLPAGAAPEAAHYAIYAEALDRAYRDRLRNMGASDSETRPSCTSHFCVALRLVCSLAHNRHPDEQRHHVVRPGAGQAELDPSRRAAAQQHVPDGGAVAEDRRARGRRIGRAQDHAVGGADPVLHAGFRHGPRPRVPLPAHRRQRRRGRAD